MIAAANIRIGCWRLRITAEPGLLAAIPAGLEHDLAAATLAPALAALDPGGDEILVIERLVAPPLRLASAQNEAALAAHATAFGQAARSVRGQRRFRNQTQALAAMLRAAARHDSGNLWIWRGLGFLEATDPASAMPLRGGAWLARLGPEAWTVLHDLASHDDLRHLWPLLPDQTLLGLAQALAPDKAATARALPADPGTRSIPLLARSWLRAHAPAWLNLPPAGSRARARATAQLALAAAGWTAQEQAVADPTWQQRILDSATCLYLQAAEPAHPAQPEQAAAPSPARPPCPAGILRPAPLTPAAGPAHPSPANPPPEPWQAPAPDPGAAADLSLSTGHAGLLFLLPLLPASGVLGLEPARLFRSGGLTARLIRLATLGLGVPLADPSVRAFAGLWPGRVPGDNDPHLPPPMPARSAAATRETRTLLARLQAGLALRSRQTLTTRQVIPRPGRLTFRPGEIDLYLDLTRVETDIRRAGLDATPGFLPWLGCTLRISYEEP